ncbi:MAG TPA: nickel pincer cofactor biosynthesis protein LarC [Candidatus Dormibacteraeota bacterium]
MTIAYFDCFSGISGDMALGALVDAGGDLAVVEGAIEALELDREVRVSARHEQRGHLGGTRVLVEVRDGPPRTVPALKAAVEGAELPAAVRRRTLGAIDRIAAAESQIHNLPVESLHLHELGGADTLVDLVGTFWLLESLGVERVHAGPLPAPRGWLREMPLPAPATLQILAGSAAVLEPDERGIELVTPTGAAILATVASFERPAMTLTRAGYGIGGRDLPGNALGVWLGRPVPEAATVAVIETNLDDLPPTQLAALVEDLMAAGALDVTVTPALMKKGRPGHLLSVMAAPDLTQPLSDLVLRHSSALGLRVSRRERVFAGRRLIEVETRWGKVGVKVKELGDEAVDVAAEHDDALRVARATGEDPRRVIRAAEAAARRELGLE